MRTVFLAVACAAMIAPVSADAGVRTFFQPAVGGASLDACLGNGICGKPAADAFCKSEGYDKALVFERQSFAETRALDTGKQCSGASCNAFKQVKCFSTKSDLASLP
jgi:hypothetical protein